jgi:uncharacterized phiE125 gp8 family phage protein
MAVTSNVPPPLAALSEAKAYLRIADDGEDATMLALLAAATGLCEGFTGQALLARAVTEMIPAGEGWRRLSITPVRSIDSVEGMPAEGPAFAFAVDAYAIDIDANATAGCGSSGRVAPGGRVSAILPEWPPAGTRCPSRCGRESSGWSRISSPIATGRTRGRPQR